MFTTFWREAGCRARQVRGQVLTWPLSAMPLSAALRTITVNFRCALRRIGALLTTASVQYPMRLPRQHAVLPRASIWLAFVPLMLLLLSGASGGVLASQLTTSSPANEACVESCVQAVTLAVAKRQTEDGEPVWMSWLELESSVLDHRRYKCTRHCARGTAQPFETASLGGELERIETTWWLVTRSLEPLSVGSMLLGLLNLAVHASALRPMRSHIHSRDILKPFYQLNAAINCNAWIAFALQPAGSVCRESNSDWLNAATAVLFATFLATYHRLGPHHTTTMCLAKVSAVAFTLGTLWLALDVYHRCAQDDVWVVLLHLWLAYRSIERLLASLRRDKEIAARLGIRASFVLPGDRLQVSRRLQLILTGVVVSRCTRVVSWPPPPPPIMPENDVQSMHHFMFVPALHLLYSLVLKEARK